MAEITLLDVLDLDKLSTLTEQADIAAVVYNIDHGEPFGLKVSSLIQMDNSIAENTASLALTDASLALKADKSVEIIAGAGLTGGGDLSAARTFNVVSADDGITVNANDIKLNIVNNLTTSSATRALSATQGKKLQDEKEALANKSTDIVADAASTTKYPSVKLIKDYADSLVAELHPEIAFYTRWLADTGTQLDEELLLKVYADYLNNLPETEFLFCPQIASKNRTSGVNQYINTMYDLGEEENDAVQTTEATQPYLGGYIAPNENRYLKLVSGQTQTGLLDFTDVVFATGDSWTLTARLKANSRGRIYLSPTISIIIGAGGTVLDVVSSQRLSTVAALEMGKAYTLEFQYSNGAGLILFNAVPQTTNIISGAITFGQISYNSTYPFDGTLYSLHLTNTRKAAYQSQLDHQFMSLLFPDMESVTIGNQVWSTSNFEGTVAGDGTVIPEVQGAETAADSTNIYNTVYAATTGSAAVKDLAATKAAAMWCHYDNSAANGAVYGKLYNWYAVHLFDLFPPVKGWRVPSKADFDQLIENQGGPTVAGGKLKAKFGGFDKANASNESGFSAIPGGKRVSTDSSFTGITTMSYLGTTNLISRTWGFALRSSANDILIGGEYAGSGVIGFMSLRMTRNEPAGANELSYTSGLFTTDIISAAKQIAVSFGRSIDYIRIKSENALTAIEAKLHNAAGTAVATLITGKSVSAGATMVFPVSADYAALLQDGTVRVTASGNSGAAVGMEIQVLTHKSVL